MKNKILLTGLYLLVFIIPFEIDFRHLNIQMPIINTNLEVLSLFLIFLWITRKIKRKDFRYKTTPFDMVIFLFISWHFITSFFAIANPLWAVKYSLKLLGGILLFYLVVDTIETKEQLKKVMFIFILSGCIVSMLGIFERVFPDLMKKVLWIFNPQQFHLPEGDTLRIKSSFIYPNILAQYLEIIIMVFIGFLLRRKGPFKETCWDLIRKWFLPLVVFVMLSETLILTYSRGGLIALMGGLLFVLILTCKIETLKSYSKKIFFAFAIVIVLFSITTIYDTVFSQRLKSIFKPSYQANLERIYLWQSALKMIKEHPFIGVGPDNYRWIYAERYASFSPFSSMRIVGGIPSTNSNNLYLESFANTGIIGIILFIWLISKIFIYLVEILKYCQDKFLICITLGIIGSFASFFIHGLVDCFWQFQSIVILFWIIVGILALEIKFIEKE